MNTFRLLVVIALATALPGCGAGTGGATTAPTTTTTTTMAAPTTTIMAPATTTTTLAPAQVGRFAVTASEDGPFVIDDRYPDPMVDVFRPVGDGPWPVVVWLHGGGQRRQGLEMPPAIASLGAVVVVPTWASEATDEMGSYDWEAPGAACAIRFARVIAPRYGGDPDTMILAGHSAGAILALSIATVGDELDTRLCANPEVSSSARFVATADAPNAFEYIKWGVEGAFLDLLDPSLHFADNPQLEGVHLVAAGLPWFRTVAQFYAEGFTGAGVPAKYYLEQGDHATIRDPDSTAGKLYLAVMQMVLAEAA